MQRTPMKSVGLRETCTFQYVIDETHDISEYLDFGFYDHLYYKENAGLGVMAIGS